MSEQIPMRVSFAALDKEAGLPEPSPASGEEYSLPAWYRSIRDLPLDELGIEDISKALRQSIHIDHVVPLALRRLQLDPLAGDMYDGELLASCKSVPPDYWAKHPTECLSLKSIIKSVLQEREISDFVQQDVQEILRKTA